MKKSLIFLATAFLLNASVAKSYPPPPLLDDSASFRIAKSVKLGYGDSSRSPSKGTGTKTSDFKTCSSDNNCPSTQKCVDGNCKDVCSPNPCPEETPDCEAKDHSYTCKCTEKSCGEGKQCVGDKCEPCEEGTTCNCEGSKVIDSSGKCVCPKNLSCSAGQYVSGDCSCKNCQKDDTSGDKCGCPGNTVPDGNGSCYCKETKTCNPGYTFDDSYSCDCVVCTGSDCNCPEGTVPTPDGCKEYACAVDEDCAEGNRCENGKTENAQCVPCGKNEQCRCPEGQLSDGTGKCVPVACKTGLVCSKDITEQCCDAGMQCVNPDTVESYCAACEVDTQCTCPDGYLVNKEGKCVKPACKTNSDCPNGKYCENPGKSNAECIPCNEGEPCPTCPTGYVADGKGGCKLGCTFDTASVCVSGTTNCKTCTQSGGCYVCTDCKDGYYPDNGTCVSCKQKFGDNCEKCTPNKCTTCDDGYEPDPYTGKCKPKACPPGHSTTIKCENGTKEAVSSYYSGASVCKKCVNCNAGEQCACPAGQLADGKGGCKSVDPCANVSCDGGKVCSAGKCVCPSSAPYTDGSGKCQPCLQDSHCSTNQYCRQYSDGSRACSDDCLKICPVGYRNGGRENILQNGCSNGYVQSGTCNSGRPCWACADAPAQTCSDLGYQDSLGPWTSTCVSGGGNPKQTKLSSGRTCYYCDKGTSCSSMSSSFFEVGSKTCPTGETAVYTGQSANGKKCYWCKASCSKWGYFAKGKGNCSSTQKEVETTQTGTEGKCYTCAKKTCEDYGLTSDPSKSPQPNFVVTTINGTKCYCVNCSNSGASSSSGTSSSDSCSSLTSGKIPNGDTVCTKKSDGSFYFSYIKLSSGSTGYSLSQSGVSTSLVSCSCTSKSRYGTSCVQASCTHKYGGSSFTVTGSF